MHCKQLLLTLGLAAGLAGTVTAAPYPGASTPAPIDLGRAQSVFDSQAITVTVALQLRNTDALQPLLRAIYTPGSTQYLHFLGTEDFSAQFGPTPETVAQVTRHYQSAGLTVTRASTTLLKITGSTSAIEASFGVELHAYEVPALPKAPAYRYRAPLGAPQISADIAPAVQAILGLDTRPSFHPHVSRAADQGVAPLAVALSPAAGVTTADPPGLWTVADFAQYYDVDPLYQEGLNGRHRTIGIVTLAAFTPSDAFAYWNSLSLPVSADRIRVVEVDGGSGPPSDATGSDETTLDVEQSGGVAPAANIVVYEAPNTTQGVVDAFAAVFDANVADTVSTSWGEWEYFSASEGASLRRTVHDLFIKAALQGQSMYAATGDAGAYTANVRGRTYPLPAFSKVLSVESPASQPFVTAAGGTTLPGTQFHPRGLVTIPTEQAWGWDYLEPLCALRGLDPVRCNILPVGGGGGVSVLFPRPFYQFGVPGMVDSEPAQSLIDETLTPPLTLVTLPTNFIGRNVPDVSLNADPETGYVVWYTSDEAGFEILTFNGGTSFVAPQLSGVTALLDQGIGYRVGLLNFALYDLVRSGRAYGGPNPPLRDIVAGDNWFYNGLPGYDQASGVGVLDVANLYRVLKRRRF